MDNNSKVAAPAARGWLPAVAVALLAAQVALLWLQGALLNRQRAELVSLRSEIADLSVAINETMFVEDGPYATPVARGGAGACPLCGRGRAGGARASGGE